MAYVKLKNLFEEQSLLNDINGILNWDMATYMPQNSRNQRVRQIQKILDYKKSIFDLIKKNELFKKINDSSLSPEDKLNLNLMRDKFEYFDIVPYEYIKKKTSLAILCEGEWRKAKLKSNFNLVKKSFKKLVDVIKYFHIFFLNSRIHAWVLHLCLVEIAIFVCLRYFSRLLTGRKRLYFVLKQCRYYVEF